MGPKFTPFFENRIEIDTAFCSNILSIVDELKYNAGSFYVKSHDLVIIFESASIKTVVSFNR